MEARRDRRLRITVGFCGLAVISLLMALTPVHANQPVGRGTVAEMVAALKPGGFLWLPKIAPSGPMLMVVNIQTQRAALYRNGIPIGITTVSTGRVGHETPSGIYYVLQKKAVHRSSLYDDAPMPFMQRLTWDGVALHGGVVPGYPASHGCIRLPAQFARLLFRETRVGMLVVVTRLPIMPTMALTGAVPLMPKTGEGMTMMWREVPGTSPLAILVSTADQEVRVIRNGKEIGAAQVTIKASVNAPIIYQLQADGKWLRIFLPGQKEQDQEALDANGVEVEPAFRQHVLAASVPGTTVIVTPDPLRPSSSSAYGLLHGDPRP
ncbi:L,D-transpeptidase family protein [Sphingomonas melonis]|uniref:L,D-transpeptidase family protein n=1 Tax=Sphingomonas melonis TaxID=152682 RepID=UPI0036D82D0E